MLFQRSIVPVDGLWGIRRGGESSQSPSSSASQLPSSLLFLHRWQRTFYSPGTSWKETRARGASVLPSRDRRRLRKSSKESREPPCWGREGGRREEEREGGLNASEPARPKGSRKFQELEGRRRKEIRRGLDDRRGGDPVEEGRKRLMVGRRRASSPTPCGSIADPRSSELCRFWGLANFLTSDRRMEGKYQ